MELVAELVQRGLAKAVSSVTPSALLPGYLTSDKPRGYRLIAVGKAAPEMTATAIRHWSPPIAGVVAAPRQFSAIAGLQCYSTSHPHIDSASIEAGACALDIAAAAKPTERLLVLVSGGGSSALEYLRDGVSMGLYNRHLDTLFSRGIPIHIINQFRKACSRVKNGGLMAASNTADILTFVISDVVGDDPSDIASGPTVYKPLDEHALVTLEEVLGQPLRANTQDVENRGELVMCARNDDALGLLAEQFVLAGMPTQVMRSCQGDAFSQAQKHCARILASGTGRHCFVSGGEMTSTAKSANGRGGPNHEYVLGAAAALNGRKFVAAAIDTDGFDGNSHSAGALVWSDGHYRKDWATMIERGIASSQSELVAAAIGTALELGHTGTNVNDLRVIVVDT